MKTMKWHIYQTARCNIIENFLIFNEIKYELVNLWDSESEHRNHHIPDKLVSSTDNVLVISIEVLSNLLDLSVSKQNIIDFLNNNNHIFVWTDKDVLDTLNYNKKRLTNLDLLLPKNKLHIFVDAIPSNTNNINQLKNIQIIKITYNQYMSLARAQNACIHKDINAKDFLFTAIKNRSGIHKQILWKEIKTRNALISKGNVLYKTRDNELIVDEDHDILNADLYHNSWLEVVAETHYKDGYFFTEKSTKPITAKTPFLVVSTCGYLKYLKSFGFQTFDSLIDEKYDLEYQVQDRVKLIVDQLEDIIKNGTESFYHASRPILDHNYSLLAEISGKLQHETDMVIQQSIDQIHTTRMI
jgi:hypothetical protein